MNPSIPCAYLRVYQPLTALSPAERDRYDRTAAFERGGGTVRAHPLGLIAADERKEFYIRETDAGVLVCPAQTHLRTLLGLLAFERSVPDGAERLFFDADELAKAHRQIEELKACPGGLRPAMIQSPWHVPIRWFVCFEDSDRRIEQDDEHLRLRYETPLRAARARVEKALDVLKAGAVHPTMVGMVQELHEWAGDFHEGSVLELDYASVSRLFADDELADDHSAKDVWEAVSAVADGDALRAGLYYQRVNERWSTARGRESLN